MTKKSSVYNFNDFRSYLKEAFKDMKEANKNFSFRYFSRVAGFKSPSVLKQVMEGQINLSAKSISKFAKAFQLNNEESNFFRHLVLFTQAKTVAERQSCLESMVRCRAFKKLHPLSSAQLNYYRHWYYIPLRELVGFKRFREDLEWISKQIAPNITPQEAKKAIGELLLLGLLKRDENNRLVQSEANVSTGNEAVSASLANYHKEMMKKGSEAIDRFPRELRDISAVTLGISGETIKTIKEMVQKFRKELIEVASHDSRPEQIYQVNFQIFPMTEKIKEEETAAEE